MSSLRKKLELLITTYYQLEEYILSNLRTSSFFSGHHYLYTYASCVGLKKKFERKLLITFDAMAVDNNFNIIFGSSASCLLLNLELTKLKDPHDHTRIQGFHAGEFILNVD